MRRMVGAHVGLAPKLNSLITGDKIETFCAPQGVLVHMCRALAGHKCGVITHVGLKTYCDPEVEACCFNDAARRAHAEGRGIVKSIEVDGRRLLHYKLSPPDVCFIKATYGDSRGNLSMEKEGLFLEQLEMAMATKNNGGIVIAQVDTLVEDNTLDPRSVKVHGHFVDYVVVGRRNTAASTTLTTPLPPGVDGRGQSAHGRAGANGAGHPQDNRPPGRAGAAEKLPGKPGLRHAGRCGRRSRRRGRGR